MKVIDAAFTRANAMASNWGEEEVLAVLATAGAAQVDWEPGDEEWARVLGNDGTLVMLLCARVPIGFYAKSIEGAELLSRVVWESFKSAEAPEFAVDPETLESIFGRPVTRNVDYSALSVRDLWWATAT